MFGVLSQGGQIGGFAMTLYTEDLIFSLVLLNYFK